jgi:hypothetical protein
LSLMCQCNTFAIGLCAECDTPVCGDHSGMFGAHRLCDQHLSMARTADVARRKQAHAESTAETIANRIRAWDDWLDKTQRALVESSDQIERIVRVVTALRWDELRSTRRDEPEILPPLLLPETFHDALPTRWWWDHNAVQSWFLRSVKRPPEQVSWTHLRKTILGGQKRKELTTPGWRFPEGANISIGEAGTPTHHWLTVSVLADGTRLIGASSEGGRTVGFNERAITQMAEMAQLAPLPRLPPMSYNHPDTGERVWPTSPDRSSLGGSASS